MTNEEIRQQIEWDRLLGSLSDHVACRASRLAYLACGEPRICVDAGTPAGSARATLRVLARRCRGCRNQQEGATTAADHDQAGKVLTCSRRRLMMSAVEGIPTE